MQFFNRIPVRRLNGTQLIEVFLICAVVTIVTVRGILHLTGYPQLGGGHLHIAHMLWGGLLLAVCLLMLILFINNKLLFYGAFLGGIGFGLFIDELGKFITRDNNYFFQPTFALIYGIFMLSFLVIRFLVKRTAFSKAEFEVNIFEKIALKEELSFTEKNIFFGFFEKADLNLQQKQNLSAILDENSQVTAASRLENYFNKAISGLEKRFGNLVRSRVVLKFVSLFFLIKGITFIILAVGVVLTSAFIDKKTVLQFIVGADSFDEWGVFVSSLVINIVILIGIFSRKSYLKKLKYFQVSILISIFFYQFFTFFSQQLNALYGVFFDFILYFSLTYMQDQYQLEKGPT